jgi:serine/threonine-protein kinase HipA
MARVLNVYLKEELVGQLEQDDSGSMRFRYDGAWLSSKSALPLSASLPLRSERFRRNECRPFFAGLLPEEDSRKLIAKAFGISDKNDFALLERIGAECAGAVSLMAPGELPVAGTPRYREVSLAELAGKFAELPRHPLLAGEDGIRLSLAGAQGKLAVAIRDGKFHLTLDGSPSSHILKPKSPHFDGLVENEFFCMRLAGRVGLEVAAVEIGTAGDTRFLQVERFDRKRLPDGRLERIHQEDFCQALGIPPELKYQQEGGPNLKKCFELVRAVSTVPGPDILRLFDAVVFNFLIGNGDAHGKNFSFLYSDGGARLAPLYDLVCTQAYPDLSHDMAMKIGDERNPSKVIERNWRKFFKEAGIGQAAAERRLVEIAQRVREHVPILVKTDGSGAADFVPVVLVNCQRLISLAWGKE